MAKLGDAFSDDERRKSVARRLLPGTVIYLELKFPEGPRSKYLVVAHVDDECCTFIVNSKISRFIETHATLSVCQVRIDAARHAFLDHNSFIACHEVWRLSTVGVVGELIADMSRVKGPLHQDVLNEVIAAVKRAPTLSPAEQTRIADSLRAPGD